MDVKAYMETINTAAAAIEAVCGKADIAVILGSGLGGYVDALEEANSLSYADIPGFEKIMKEGLFETSVPVWVHIAIFLVWGWLMYRLWVWVSRK